ncbi:MAG: hypothetical protein JXB38_02610 [Anaerolineales bacterium]|nr:hypothetical protein [Anaerolineales bacterium]
MSTVTWRFPDELASALGLPRHPDRTYTLSVIEFAGRFTRFLGTAEPLEEIERDVILIPLALAAARAVKAKVSSSPKWLLPLQAIAWRYGLFAFLTDCEQQDVSSEEIGQWAAGLFYVYFSRLFLDFGEMWFDPAAAWGWSQVMKPSHYENLALTIDPLRADPAGNPKIQPRLWHAALAVYQRWYAQELPEPGKSDPDHLPDQAAPRINAGRQNPIR